jgi:ADP-heptose:LPS heptosyltransferase
VVAVGAPGERDLNSHVLGLAGSSGRVLDLTGRTTMAQLGAVIQQCDAFLGNDTGPMHLACAVGTPVVAVFGPSNPVMHRPYLPASELVYRDVYCSPCLKDGLYRFAPDCVHQCMRSIPTEIPLAALGRVARKR